MDDPLDLHSDPTPAVIRAMQLASPPALMQLINRINKGEADSMETRISLVLHLVYLTYLDLKDNIVK